MESDRRELDRRCGRKMNKVSKMQVVKIKNINKKHMSKKFIVKGRIKPYARLVNNVHGNGVRLLAFLFDKMSCIQLIAFNENAYEIINKLKTNDIISIINASVVEVSVQKETTTNHKYQLNLSSNTIITPLSDYAESIVDFPKECKFIKGSQLSRLKPGTIVDVIGKCIELSDIIHMENSQSVMRFAKLLVDLCEIRLVFCGEKSNESYKIGSTLTLYNAQYGYRNVASLCVKYFTTVVFKVMPLLEIINIKQEDVFTSPGVMFVKEEQTPELLTNTSDQKPSSTASSTSTVSAVLGKVLTVDNCESSMSPVYPSLTENSNHRIKRNYCPSGSGSDSETYCKKSKKNNKPPMDNNTFVSIALRLMANLPESDIQDLQLRIFSMIENEYAKYE